MNSTYWKAVEENDVARVAALLDQSSSLANERYTGEAWVPGNVYDFTERKQVPAPADFPFTNTALHTAAVNARTELIEVLLRHGADANAIGYEANKGLTPPVVLAAWEGSLDTLKVLLDSGADPNVSASTETALYTAAEHHAPDKVDLLLSYGARHDIFTAVIVGNVELVHYMLMAYPPLRETRSAKRGRTPQEEAVHHEQFEVLKLF